MPKIFHQAGDWSDFRTRHFIVDQCIRKGNYPSQQALSTYCGVSKKTIQRLIRYMQDTLRAPLEYHQSKKGWYYTDNQFELPLTQATKHDLQAIMVLGEVVSQYDGTPLGKSMKQAYDRILSTFNTDESITLQRLTDSIRFAHLPSAPIDSRVWRSIIKALRTCSILQLTYRKSGRAPGNTRNFESYGLIIRDREWYLYGYCRLRNARRTLAVTFIEKSKLLDEHFDKPIDFDLDEYVKTGFRALHSDGMPELKITLRFHPDLAPWIASHPIAHNQKSQRTRNGYLDVSFKASALFEVEREVLRWGDRVEAIEPQS